MTHAAGAPREHSPWCSSAAPSPHAHDFGAIHVSSPGRGPFAPEVTAVLTAAFGTPLDGITVTRRADAANDAIGALASARGRHIALGSAIREDPTHAESMAVLAHETAHALAPTGAARTWLDQPGDAGEAAAGRAGDAMRAWVAGGAGDAPPALVPAAGGTAVVHRYEASEHKRSVDDAVSILEEDAQACGVVPPEVAEMLAQSIRLGNGVDVTPGHVTAMAGDLYGHFPQTASGRGDMDPQGSFDRLFNAWPYETRALTSTIDREDAGAHIPASEWEDMTDGRPGGDLSYLELAELNDSHFSDASGYGTDNNLGSYDAFHAMALNAARTGDLDRARALEASAMHYLTDRHAGGHSFEKQGVLNAARDESWLAGQSDAVANTFVKSVHDQYNEGGVPVSNAGGDAWTAYGDGHWADEGNRENRVRTATSVTTSWGELAAINACEPPVDYSGQPDFAAHDTVPQWDPARQADAEARARDESAAGALWNVKDSIWDLGTYKAGSWAEEKGDWLHENVVEPVSSIPDTARSWYDSASEFVDERIFSWF